jgi:3-oxoacyl-[acyl-carrier-protein] synthase III
MLDIAPHRSNRERSADEIARALATSPLGTEILEADNPATRWLARELAFVWHDFTARLARVPLVMAIEGGTIRRDDYLCYLRNLRQQVIDGGRWISQTAASMGQELFSIRSALIGHAAEEHRDYQMLEKNYVAAGGAIAEIENAPKNVASEALSSYVFHKASQPNPVGLFGAMFIIEGFGSTYCGRWAEQLRSALDLPAAGVSFFAYHGAHDDGHYDKLRAILSGPHIDMERARDIVKTARTVGRLYVLQLEELEHV